MKKQIRNFAPFLLITCFSVANAQQDPAGKQILDELSAKTKSYSTIRSKIIYTYEDKKDGTSITKEGKITLKGDKYRLYFMESVIYSDGETIWSYSPEYNEVNVSNKAEDEGDISFLENPQKLLNLYNEDYKYRLIKEYTENQTPYAVVDLYPNDLNQSFSRITLIIDKSAMQINSASVFGKNGENHHFLFKNIETDVSVEDSYFIFNKDDYRDVEIIDLRL